MTSSNQTLEPPKQEPLSYTKAKKLKKKKKKKN